ncbi:molybdopterin-dependent oxidoreductase [Paenibacillus sp. YYML68]|uniref:molybdopterin-dependent oxidoreductase n=1 Tax=Paenibacillus sp. YYML68 TaxID=2909250 RepID=UPI002490B116|nr:molybdopterin-dependent oxidoreductase [Paenibacillus sp. YYML68]
MKLQPWKELKLGRKLRLLHAWNGWTVLVLAVTGILLFVPGLRGDLAGISVRPIVKAAHIGAGILSTLLLLLYMPYMLRHIKQLRTSKPQLLNLMLVLALLIGWTVSGYGLTAVRSLPPEWTSASLLLHDVLTWIGIPLIVYHSFSRSRMLKRLKDASKAPSQEASLRTRPAPSEAPPFYTRRSFVRGVLGAGLLLLVGPPFWRWVKSSPSLFGGATVPIQDMMIDANQMLPAPLPLPESSPPIGGGYRGQFRVYTVTSIPSFQSTDWRFRVTGLVDKELSLGWDDFLQLQREVRVIDFHCVTGWSVLDCTWEGIPLTRLLELAGVKPETQFVKFYSGDGVYTDSLTLEQAQADGVMAAFLLDGQPLPNQLGGPVRLIVPDMYAYKSVKWLDTIELLDHDHVGYWQKRGYEKDAWVPERLKNI